MSNVLAKKPVVTFIPAVPGSPGTPGTPGTPEVPPHPATPGYDETVTTIERVLVGIYIVRIPPPGHDMDYPVYAMRPVTRVIHHAASAATPGIPGVPPTPGTPPVPGSPATTIINPDLGWNAGAISNLSFSGDAQFQFSIDQSSAGVVVGLNENNVGTGYVEIDYGIYAEHGLYRIIEAGAIKHGYTGFISADVFTIARVGSEVCYYQGTTKIYTSLTHSFNTLFADCSLYAAGDNIIDASLSVPTAAFAATTARVSMDLGSIGMKVADGAYFDVHMDLGSIGMKTQVWNSARVTMDLGTIGMYVTDGLTNQVHMDLGDIGMHVEAGFFAPEFNAVHMDLGGIGVLVQGLTGEVARVAMDLGSVGMKVSDYAYFDVRMDLGGIDMFVTDNVFDGYALLDYAGYNIFGIGDNDPNTLLGAYLTYDGYSVQAYGGAEAALSYAGYTVAATGVATNASQAALTYSGYTVTGAALTSDTAVAALTYGGYSVQAYGGAVAALEYGGYSISGAAITGNKATAALEYSGYGVDAVAVPINWAYANLIYSPLTPLEHATAFITYNGYTVEATANTTLTVEYEGYAATRMQSKDGEEWAVTHYTNFPFKQFIRLRGVIYGVATDGICALGGDLDISAPIVANVAFAPTNFANDKYDGHTMKRPRTMFIYGQLGGDMEVSVVVDEDVENPYTYVPQNFGKSAHRVIFGRGIRGQWLGYKFTNVDGDDFRIDGIDPEVDVLKRTIWE